MGLSTRATLGEISPRRARCCSRGPDRCQHLTVTNPRDLHYAMGPLAALIGPTTRDILINPDGTVWHDSGKGVVRAAISSLPPAVVRQVASMFLAAAGRSVDDAHPIGEGSVNTGMRVSAVLPPLVGPGPALSLRFHLPGAVGWAGFVDAEGNPIEPRLRSLIASGTSMLITGATGAGKTTLAALMLSAVPAKQRIVVIEDTVELAPRHPHVVTLQTAQGNTEGAGVVGLGSLVRTALRMRPDWLVVGEVRGAEFVDLLAALTTGHSGIGTLHAPSLTELPARLLGLAALAGLDFRTLSVMTAAAFPVVVHCERTGVGSTVRLGSLRNSAEGVHVDPI